MIESHASLPSPYLLANETCGQIFLPSLSSSDDGGIGTRSAATTFPTCAWDVVLPHKTLEACSSVLENYLIKMFDWANSAAYSSYVAVPVQMAGQDRLFIPHSASTLAMDAQAFCAHHSIKENTCAASLITAAQEIYQQRQRPIPAPGEQIVMCPRRSRVPFIDMDEPDGGITKRERRRRRRKRPDVPLVAFYHVAALEQQKGK